MSSGAGLRPGFTFERRRPRHEAHTTARPGRAWRGGGDSVAQRLRRSIVRPGQRDCHARLGAEYQPHGAVRGAGLGLLHGRRARRHDRRARHRRRRGRRGLGRGQLWRQLPGSRDVGACRGRAGGFNRGSHPAQHVRLRLAGRPAHSPAQGLRGQDVRSFRLRRRTPGADLAHGVRRRRRERHRVCRHRFRRPVRGLGARRCRLRLDLRGLDRR